MSKEQVFNIRIAGIGGQGVVSLATAIAEAATEAGLNVTIMDRPRSAMRLGPITCDVILGKEIYSPFIVPGEADLVIGLEPYDGLRNAVYLLKKGGVILVNKDRIPPIDEVATGQASSEIERLASILETYGAEVKFVDIPDELKHAGFFMLGVVCSSIAEFPISADVCRNQLTDQSDNLRDFNRGFSHNV